MSAWEGSQWQEAMERQRERTAKRGASDCGHPGCTIVDHDPRVEERCTIAGGVMISVPPGKHQHIACPVHGDHVIRGRL